MHVDYSCTHNSRRNLPDDIVRSPTSASSHFFNLCSAYLVKLVGTERLEVAIWLKAVCFEAKQLAASIWQP
jgi:hypothetical protein